MFENYKSMTDKSKEEAKPPKSYKNTLKYFKVKNTKKMNVKY
jgi:hypothetical protein